MKKKAELSMIEIEKIHPHQDNPRKNLGDVTELAESIKANGILQNLTVVQNSDDYFTVIIGHRRLAAAKQAGLTAVPCAVVEMSDSEQLSTMLTENIQRSELTAYEQAKGFQMLIDLGNSVSEVVEKTGFSESTVRRRLKLAELDEETFRKSQERQVSFKDYEKLNEIKDINKRNELLEVIGTNNFNNAVYYAKREQQAEEDKEVIGDKLKNIAIKISSNNELPAGTVYMQSCDLDTIEEFKKGIDDDRKYYYYFASYGAVAYIYAEPTAEEINKKAEEKERRELRNNKLNELEERVNSIENCCESLISDFLVSDKTAHAIEGAENKKTTILKYIAKEVIDSGNRCARPLDFSFLAEACGIKYDDGKCTNLDDCNLWKMILVYSYLIFKSRNKSSYISVDYSECRAKRIINPGLNEFYSLLCKLGYIMSDEEIRLRDGTHSIFVEEEKQ